MTQVVNGERELQHTAHICSWAKQGNKQTEKYAGNTTGNRETKQAFTLTQPLLKE
jgi:hypothetical protein